MLQVSVFLSIAWLGIGVLWLPIVAICSDPSRVASAMERAAAAGSSSNAPVCISAFQIYMKASWLQDHMKALWLDPKLGEGLLQWTWEQPQAAGVAPKLQYMEVLPGPSSRKDER